MRIAILGTRGIPANYGGFETFAEELSTRLVQRGHQVTVCCREPSEAAIYRGVQLQYLPSIRNKYFDTLAHTFVSTLWLITRRPTTGRFDVALYCNGANAIFVPLARLRGIPAALNVDGIERKRKKWNAFARAWYFMSERLSMWFPTAMISDAEVIREYYLERYGRDSIFIPYGADATREESTAALDRLGLARDKYFLFVSRFEPENHPLEVRHAFEKIPGNQLPDGFQLALIGDAPFAHDYIRQVRAKAPANIVIPGAIYGLGYRELGTHCYAYIQATEVGGTHPALIEAMGRGALVIYRNTPENAEACGDCGLSYDTDEQLTAAMLRALQMSASERQSYQQRALARVQARYSWAAVTDAYENLFHRLAG